MMRKYLLFGILALAISFSCSTDSDTETETTEQQTNEDDTNENQDPEEKLLINIEQLIYGENGSLLSKSISEYIDEKIDTELYYSPDNVLESYSKYMYNSQGKINSIAIYNAGNEKTYEATLIFDSDTRIIEKVEFLYNLNIEKNTTYNYTSNNTIVSTFNNNGNLQERTFELGSNGIINKEILDGAIVGTIVLDNQLKLLERMYYDESYIYSYQETGQNPISYYKLFGDNPNNLILYVNDLGCSTCLNFSNRFINEIESNQSTTTFDFVFDNNNLLVSMNEYKDGSLYIKNNFTYE
tara:strand:+ start:9300 stop:10190 length:891 start_codon:yes stop_codon:yes gene_type:complete